jgi:hypothetical protein
MKIFDTFATPKNEATAKFYTEVLKNRLGIEPNPFLPKKSARLILPDVRDEHSLVYTPHFQKPNKKLTKICVINY